MVTMHKPEVHWLGASERHFNYTLGGIQHYHNEIKILSENGYEHTSHDVTNRDGEPLTVAVLHRGDAVVKVYEL